MEQVYIEKDCTIEHDGHKFTSGGAFVSPVYAIGYPKIEEGHYSGIMQDWYGNTLGTCRIVSKWRVNSWKSSYMCQIEVTIKGVKYTGRGFGSGMIWHGKRISRQ